jgi:hypothetical protein
LLLFAKKMPWFGLISKANIFTIFQLVVILMLVDVERNETNQWLLIKTVNVEAFGLCFKRIIYFMLSNR